MSMPNELLRLWEKHGGDNHEYTMMITPDNFEKFCTELAEQAARMGIKLTRQLFNNAVANALKEQENTDGTT